MHSNLLESNAPKRGGNVLLDGKMKIRWERIYYENSKKNKNRWINISYIYGHSKIKAKNIFLLLVYLNPTMTIQKEFFLPANFRKISSKLAVQREF